MQNPKGILQNNWTESQSGTPPQADDTITTNIRDYIIEK
jgi:hypothetical protein